MANGRKGIIRSARIKLRRFNTNLGNFCLLIATEILFTMLSWCATSIICANFGVESIIRIPIGLILFSVLSTMAWAFMGEVFYDRLIGRARLWKLMFFVSLFITAFIMAGIQYSTAVQLIDGVTAPVADCLRNPMLQANYVGLGLLIFPIYSVGMPIGYILGEHAPLIDDLDDEVCNGQSGITP